MKFFENIKMETIVFFSGACGMILELVGSRVLAPYFGNSLYVWTSLIGLILGSLSLGYFVGGRLADQGKGEKVLGGILLITSVTVGLTAFGKEWLLLNISSLLGDVFFVALLVSTIVLFVPASFFLGVITPIAVKSKIKNVKDSGRVVGRLYAISTVGSIVGTYFAGFWMIPQLGNLLVMYVVSFMLAILSIFTLSAGGKFLGLWLLGLSMLIIKGQLGDWSLVADMDSMYSRIQIEDYVTGEGRMMRSLSTDNGGWESAIYLDNPDELVFDYNKAYRFFYEVPQESPDILVIGGVAYTFPRDLKTKYPQANIDVVEIDPKMTESAQRYFGLSTNPGFDIIHEDARVFLKKSTKKYDAIFIDAFLGVTPPFHLTTKEFMSDIKRSLKSDGLVLLNLISSVVGERSGMLAWQYNTLKSVFANVDVYFLGKYFGETGNNLVLAYDDNRWGRVRVSDLQLKELLSDNVNRFLEINEGKIFTDDRAPVEFLTRYLSLGI